MTTLLFVFFVVAVVYGCSPGESYRPRYARREELEQAIGRLSRLSIG